MKLSVVVPAYNEQESFPSFYPKLVEGIKKAVGESYEILLVNDGSTDDTLQAVRALAKQNKQLKCLGLSRNFGKEIAITAGVQHATGDAVLIIDADGQHPAKLIKDFVDLWKDGYQVVVGIRKSNKKEGVIKRYGSKFFYKAFNATSDITLIPNATDFRLIDRAVQKEFIKFTERNRIARGVIDWMGFKQAFVTFHANKRIAGKASYKFSKLFSLALDSFISLSVAPLYAIGYVGFFITVCSLVLGLFVLVEQLILSDPLGLRITGTAMLVILTLFLVGIILISQGLLAIYLSHIHSQTQDRPLFIVDMKNSVNID